MQAKQTYNNDEYGWFDVSLGRCRIIGPTISYS